MSTVRFIHTDLLRLGTPLSGLTQSPGWLHKLATGATRQAVRNLIDAAISNRVAFVLITSDVAESKDDLAPALTWLKEQFQTLRAHNIRIVMTAGSAQTHTILRSVCDVVLSPTESLHVSCDPRGVQMAAVASERMADPDLVVEVGDATVASQNHLTYRARPALQRSADLRHISQDGHLCLSAGVLQSTSPAERSAGGALLLEADISGRRIQSEFVECDVIRFQTEAIPLSAPSTFENLIAQVLDGSETVRRSPSRTVVMDWVLTGALTTEMPQIGSLTDSCLLASLREQLHAGHQGIWLRALSFADSTSIEPTVSSPPVVLEYVDRDLSSVRNSSQNTYRRPPHDEGLAQELLTGLTFLSRVA